MAISAGPLFKFNPSISFILNFDPSRDKNARKNLDAVWEKLSKGGTALMPLDKYPFGERYGWIQDKYRLSWQLILSNPDGEERPFIVLSLSLLELCAAKRKRRVTFISRYLETQNEESPHAIPKGWSQTEKEQSCSPTS